MNRITEQLHEREATIIAINNQRRKWLYASSVIFSILIIFAITLHKISHAVWWIVSAILIIIGINWWYWTMHVIHTMLHNQAEQIILIRQLIKNIKKLKGL